MSETSDSHASGGEAALLWGFIETWWGAIDDLTSLACELPEEQWDLPTDLAGWSVKDNVAHTAHLEAVLAGAPEETIEVAAAPHLRGPMSFYTEQGVLARRGRSMTDLVEEIRSSARRRYDALRADPPTRAEGTPSKTPGDVGWTNLVLHRNRPLDVFMHEQDIRRATGREGNLTSPAGRHTLRVLLDGALPMVLGKRVAPPAGTSVRVVLSDQDRVSTVAVADDGRARPAKVATPDVAITLTTSDYLVLAGGRRTVEQTSPSYDGDADLGRSVLERLATTP